MEGKIQYPNLKTALRYFKGQVYESVPYALENLPRFQTPKQIFDWFKLRTTYINDPKGIELFQSLPTLLDNNYHGISGGGDCDCFTCGVLAALAANNFKNYGIVLVGRTPFSPVHIYAWADYSGERQYIDLTNRVFNFQRDYPYRQELKFYYN